MKSRDYFLKISPKILQQLWDGLDEKDKEGHPTLKSWLDTMRKDGSELKVLGGKQLQVFESLKSDADVIIIYGAVRTGKSMIAIRIFILYAMFTTKGGLYGIGGATYSSVYKVLIIEVLTSELFNKLFIMKMHLGRGQLRVARRDDPKVYNIFQVYGAGSDMSQGTIQGQTWEGIFMDEAFLHRKMIFNEAFRRIYFPKFVKKPRVIMTMNPGDIYSDFYKEWIAKDANPGGLSRLLIHLRLDDNPAISEERRAQLKAEAMEMGPGGKLIKGIRYMRDIEGMWTMSEGLIYPHVQYVPWDINNLDVYRRKLQQHGFVKLLGADLGKSDATVILEAWYGIDEVSKNEQVYVLDGFHGSGSEVSTDIIANWIKAKGHANHEVVSDSNFPFTIEDLNVRGLNVVGASKPPGSVLESITALKRMEIFINSNLDRICNDFKTYSYAKDSDKPAHEGSHSPDALKYPIMRYKSEGSGVWTIV